MRSSLVAGAALALVFSFPVGATAQTLAVCGASDGYAYYVEGGAVIAPESGWMKDSISGGRTTLSINANDELDLSYSDATGGVYSSIGEGGNVILLRMSKDEAAVLVNHPRATAEIYQFVRDASGRQLMLLLQSKGTDLMKKSAVYLAPCSVLNLVDMD